MQKMGPRAQMRGFGKAVAWGTLAGAALPLAFTTILALSFLPDVFSGKMTIGQILYLLGLPLIVAFPIVLLASIVFGLPLTALLRRINREWFGLRAGRLCDRLTHPHCYSCPD
jgi:hypothetical protein